MPDEQGAEMTRADRKIVLAAIQHQGVTFTVPRPGRHGDIIYKMHKLGLGPECTHNQGFMTSDGMFVRRETALLIAQDAGQITSKTGNPNVLFSEDLW